MMIDEKIYTSDMEKITSTNANDFFEGMLKRILYYTAYL